MSESRRLRTQAERDADGTTWRAPLLAEATRWRVALPAGTLKGITEADAYRLGREHGVRPDRSLVRLYADGTEELGPWSPAPMPQPPQDVDLCGHVTYAALGGYKLVCVQTPGHRGPHQADSGARWSLISKLPADTSWIHTTEPRRRWWHRYTRRNP